MAIQFVQIDGDTFHMVDDSGAVLEKIRIGGVDTHESQPNANPTALGKLASEYIEQSNPQVRSGTEIDVYGRRIGSYTDGEGGDLANRAVRQGLGFSTSANNDSAFRDYAQNGRLPESDPKLEAILQEMDNARASGAAWEQSPYKTIDPGYDPKGSTGDRALTRGVHNLKASAYAFLQSLNDVTGDDESADVARQKAAYFAEKAGMVDKDVNSYKDVDSLGKAATYAYELLMEEAPSLVLDAGMALTGVGAGAAIGRRAAITAMRKKLGNEAFEDLAAKNPQLMANIAADGATAGAKRGAAAGYVAGTYPQEVGAVQQELNKNGIEDAGETALAMGALSTGVQVLPEIALAGKLLKSADVDASDLSGIVNVGKQIAKNTGTTAITEGSAEAMATVIQKSAVALHDSEYEVFSDANIADIKESAVAGATLGGLLGGTSTTGAAAYRKADQIYQEKRQAIADTQAEARAAESQAAAPAGDAAAGIQITQPPAAPPEKREFQQVFSDTPPVREETPPNDLAAEVTQPPVVEPPVVEEQAAIEEQSPGQDTQPPETPVTDEIPLQMEIEQLLSDIPTESATVEAPPQIEESVDGFPLEDEVNKYLEEILAKELGDTDAIVPSQEPLAPSEVEPTPQLRGESIGQAAQYGEGNPSPDGIYDRGTGRGVFMQMAEMAADEGAMRKSANGQTKATNKFKEMAATIDPLSNEFDGQMEVLAKYLRTWGDNKADDVNQLLDRARLREPEHTQTAPVLRESFDKLGQLHGVQLKGDTLEKFQSAVGYVDQLATSLSKTVEGFEKAPDFRTQMADILDVVSNGGVKLSAKQQSVVHAIAANSFVSASNLWKPDTGTTQKVYAEQNDKVAAAQVAPTAEKAPVAPDFVANKPESMDRAELIKHYKDAKSTLRKIGRQVEFLLGKKDFSDSDAGMVKAYNKVSNDIMAWMRTASPMFGKSKKKMKALAALGTQFVGMAKDSPNLVEAIRVNAEKPAPVVQDIEKKDDENAVESSVSVVGTTGKALKDIADISDGADLSSSIESLPTDLLPHETELVDKFVRLSLGISKDAVDAMPVAAKVEYFSQNFASSAASDDIETVAKETANERRVRVASKLQTTIAIVDSFKAEFEDVIAQKLLPEYLRANPSKTEKDFKLSAMFVSAMEGMERAMFEAALNRLVGVDHPDFIYVYNISSARQEIKQLRSEIQNLAKTGFEQPVATDARPESGTFARDGRKYEDGQLVEDGLPEKVDASAWGDARVYNTGEKAGQIKPTSSEDKASELADLSRQRDRKLGGRTSRDMFDVSVSMLNTISSAVRMLVDARFNSNSHPELRQAILDGRYSDVIDYAADNDFIPALGNTLDQLINNTVEFAASNRSSMLPKYFVRKEARQTEAGVIPLTLVDDLGNTTKVFFDLARMISDHVERFTPNMIDADHGARDGADFNEDGVRDESDPLSGRASFDRIAHIKQAYDLLLSDISDIDPRLFGFRVSRESINDILTNKDLVLLKDGPDSVTLGHLMDTLQTRAVQAQIASNHLTDHDLTETKRAKAAAAMGLEAGLIQLLDIVSPENGDQTKLTLLATMLSKANGTRQSAAHIARATANIPRQLGALSRLVYGKNNSHLDTVSGTDSKGVAFTSKTANTGDKHIDNASAKAVKDDLDSHLFTEPSITGARMDALNKIAFDARNSAHRSKLGTGRDALLEKYATVDGNDFTKTTEMVDISFLSQLFDVISKNAAAFDIESPKTGADMTAHYNSLIENREKLALSYNNRDYASIADDQNRTVTGPEVETIHTPGRGKQPQGGNATIVQNKEPKDDGTPKEKKPPYDLEAAKARIRGIPDRAESEGKQETTVAHDEHILPQIREIMGNSKYARIASNALVRMSNIVFGDPKFINKIQFRDPGDNTARIEMGTDAGTIDIYLPFSTLQMDSAEGMSKFFKMAAHEFGHAVATIQSMNAEDADIATEFYEKDIPKAERAKYGINEYIADLVAMRLLEELSLEGVSRNDSVSTIDSMVYRLAARISRVLKIAGEFGTSIVNGMFTNSPQLEFAEYLLKRRRVRSDKFEALAGQDKLYYTERGTNATIAKAKSKAFELAKGGLDSAIVKLFKPTAMRLQKIDRVLARMFFNPPGASHEQGMGLMDMAVSSRTQLVHHFNRLYSKVDDFRKDYVDYLDTGKSTDALNGVFRRAAEMYGRVNPEFKYTGIPLMLNTDELARRGAEFVQILAHEKADALLDSFDRTGGDATMNTDIKPANPFGRQELIDQLIRERPEVREKLQAAGFFDPPTVAGLNKFLGGVAIRTEFERIFSGMDELIPELGLSVRTPNQKLKARLDAISDIDKRKEAIAMIGSMLGFDGARVHPSWRATQDWTIATVSAMILPLSGFASLPDPMMPFIRTRSWSEAAKGLFNVVRAYATDYKRTSELTRALSLATNTIHDTVWSTVVINRDGNSFPEKMSEVLFRYNGLQFLTNLSRNVSAVLAIDMVRRHGSGMTAYSRQFLTEMGISSYDAGRLIAYMDEHGTIPQYRPGDDVTNELHDIAQRVVTTFTNSSLIHPNKAQLPAIANDPNFRILTLLKPFLYGFQSTIYGGGLRAGRNAMANPRTLSEFLLASPAGVAPLILAFGLMMPLAAAGLLAREAFRDFLTGSNKVGELQSMDDMEYLNKIFARSGGYGIAEYPMQIWDSTQVDYRNPIITALGPVAGTLNTTASDAYGAFVKGNRDSVRFGLIEVPVE